jgi:hypothetical protein
MEYIALDVHKKYTWVRVRIHKENGCTRVGWHTLMGQSRTLFIAGVKDLRWQWKPWGIVLGG